MSDAMAMQNYAIFSKEESHCLSCGLTLKKMAHNLHGNAETKLGAFWRMAQRRD